MVKYDPSAWERLGDKFSCEYSEGALDFRENTVDVVVRSTTENSDVLDMACGDGWLVYAIRCEGYLGNYLGIDITPNIIQRARQMRRERFVVGNAMEMIFGDKSYDFVVCAGILMHVDDHVKVIKEACRVSSKFVFFSTYGTFGPTYGVHDQGNGFLNYFFNKKDIVSKVPCEFKKIQEWNFPRKRRDHIFQFLYERVQ